MASVNPVYDPLGHRTSLTLTDQFPVLGIPVLFRTNSTAVMAAIERTFSAWRSLLPAFIEEIPPLVIEVVVPESAPTCVQDDTRHTFAAPLSW